jgi:hypothetical protein
MTLDELFGLPVPSTQTGGQEYDPTQTTQAAGQAGPTRTTLTDLFLARPVPELRTAPPVAGYVEEPQPPTPSLVEQYGPTAVRMLGAPAGMIAGSIVGQPMAGAALGGAAGEVAARALGGQEQKVLPTIAAAAGGLLGGVTPTAAGLGEAVAQGGLLNYGATALSSLAEQGQLPTGPQTLTSLFLGGVGGGIAGRGPAATARAAEQAPLRQGIEEALQPPPAAPPAAGTEDIVGPALAQVPQGEVLPPVQELVRTPAAETPTSSLLRQAQESQVTPVEAVPESPTSTLLSGAQETVTTGRSPLADALNNVRGGTARPVISGLTRGAIGGTIGATQGDTPAERARNAAIGAGLAAGGPVLLSQLLKRLPAALSPAQAGQPQVQTPIDEMVATLGDAARKVEHGAEIGDFTLAHAVADQALEQLDTLNAKVGEITPENRLFRVVADTVMPAGAEKAANLATVSGAARVLQRYSDLAQRLQAMAAQGDDEAGKMLNTLFGGTDADLTRRIVQLWRGSITGRVATGISNAFDQGTILTTSMLDHLHTGVAEGLLTGRPIQGTAQGAREALTLGRVAGQRMWKGLSEATHLAATEPDKLDTVLSQYPEVAQRALQKPEGLEGRMGKYVEMANKVNQVQENFFRRTILEAELVNGLQRQGIDPAAALRAPGMIPPEVLTRAQDAALQGTLAYKPDGRLGRAVSQFFHDVPEAHLLVPFPRYMANRMQYMFQHSPLGLVRLWTQGAKREGLEDVIAQNTALLGEGGTAAAKAQFNIERATQKLGRLDTPAEVVGKVLTGGVVPLVAALTLRTDFPGEHWWEVQSGEKRLDMRRNATMGQYMFLGELAKEIKTEGKITMSPQDLAQGIALAGTRAGVGLTLVDMLTGRGGVTMDGVTNLAADLAAMIPAGFFNPVSQLKDIAAVGEGLLGQDLPPESVQRAYREPLLAELLGRRATERQGYSPTLDEALSRLVGPTINQFPFLSRLLPERPSATAAAPLHTPYPAAHFVGLPITTPNPVEQAIGRLGIPPQSIFPREFSRTASRGVTQGMGGTVERVGGALVGGPGFQAAPTPLQKSTLKDLLATGRKVGLAKLAARDPRLVGEILLRRRLTPEQLQTLGLE